MVVLAITDPILLPDLLWLAGSTHPLRQRVSYVGLELLE